MLNLARVIVDLSQINTLRNCQNIVLSLDRPHPSSRFPFHVFHLPNDGPTRGGGPLIKPPQSVLFLPSSFRCTAHCPPPKASEGDHAPVTVSLSVSVSLCKRVEHQEEKQKPTPFLSLYACNCTLKSLQVTLVSIGRSVDPFRKKTESVCDMRRSGENPTQKRHTKISKSVPDPKQT